MSSGDGNVWAGRMSEAADSSCQCWPAWDRRDMFYNMWVRVDVPPQTGEGKGQSRERTSVSHDTADTDESLSTSVHEESNPDVAKRKHQIHQNVEIHQRRLGQGAEISCSIHYQFSFFFYYRNIINVIKQNLWSWCYLLFMQTGKWDSSSSGYDFGTLSCRRLNTSVSFDSTRLWLLSEGQSRPELGRLGRVCLLWLQPWLLYWI